MLFNSLVREAQAGSGSARTCSGYYLNGCYIQRSWKWHFAQIIQVWKTTADCCFPHLYIAEAKIKIPESDIFHMLDYSLNHPADWLKGY